MLGHFKLIIPIISVDTRTKTERRVAITVCSRVRSVHSRGHGKVLRFSLFGYISNQAPVHTTGQVQSNRTGERSEKVVPHGNGFVGHLKVHLDLKVGDGGQGRRPRSRGYLEATFVAAELALPEESRVAVPALVWLLVLVDELVGLELVRVAELGLTDLANVRPLARVHSQVPAQVRHLDELSMAVVTVVRLFSRVQP